MIRKILKNNMLYTLLSILIGFLVGGILIFFIGVNPLVAYGKLFSGVFSKAKYIAYDIIYAAPYILTGLSVAFAFKTGVFNIGAEGQFVVGALCSMLVGLFVKAPTFIHVILCFLASILAGGLFGFLVSLLKVKRGINEVLSYIMFNWIAFYLSNFVINIDGVHAVGGNAADASKTVLDSARIYAPQVLRDFTKCSDLNYGIVIAVVCAIAIWFIMSKTTLGYQLKAVGFNKNASQYAGISANKIYYISMTISGILAGMGGAVQCLGMSGRISQYATQEGFGFQGITVALIAGSNPIGCIFSGLFYGIMKYGGNKLTMVQVPIEVINIIMGIIVKFIAVSGAIKMFILDKVKDEGGKKNEHN